MRNLKKLDLASNELSDHSTKPGYFPHSLTSLNLTNNQWNSFPLGIVIKGVPSALFACVRVCVCVCVACACRVCRASCAVLRVVC
jgi:hypothetical protein